jgi:aspartyl-tRNA(Asn)/glutamyl-tRNA(Gln) amidotransferase subunit B
MYNPIIVGGYVDAPLDDGTTVRVQIHHAHMEEDAGKLTHFGDYSLVDLNRAGTPLIEIVSEPDIHSAAGAKAYATELYRLMTYAGVTLGDLYHGNMRFDVNVSIAPKGATELGTRAEVKNLNSFKSVERAAEYEFNRQVELLEKGERVVQETRGWDDAKQKTTSQRSKEDAQDYRYMPDADIPPIVLSDEEIAEIQSTVPKLPSQFRKTFKNLHVDQSVINSLLATSELAHLVDSIQQSNVVSKADEFDAFLSVKNLDPRYFIELADMYINQEINSNASDAIFLKLLMKDNIKSPKTIAEDENLIQESNESAIITIVDEVLADPASAQAVNDLKQGNDKVIGFLVGQVMKKSQGKANPELAQKLIRERVQ